MPTKLEGSERTQFLEELKSRGWTTVENRDAIYKEFTFENFNEVGIYFILIALNHNRLCIKGFWIHGPCRP